MEAKSLEYLKLFECPNTFEWPKALKYPKTFQYSFEYPQGIEYPKIFEYPNTFGYPKCSRTWPKTFGYPKCSGTWPNTFGYLTEKNWNYPARPETMFCPHTSIKGRTFINLLPYTRTDSWKIGNWFSLKKIGNIWKISVKFVSICRDE